MQHHHPRIPTPSERALSNQFAWQVIIIIAQPRAHRWNIAILAVRPTGMMPVAAGYKPRWPHRLYAYVPKKFAAARKILDDRAQMNVPALDLVIAALERVRQTSDSAP